MTPDQQSQTANVRVNYNAVGDEKALSFSLGFNPALLSNPLVTLSGALQGATLNVNTSQVAQGNLGIALMLSGDQTLAEGSQQLANVAFSFAAANRGAVASFEFKDAPVARLIVDANGNPAAGQYNSGPAVLALATTSVSAANFVPVPLAAEQIVAAFGTTLATGTQSANTVPLPATLLGTTVKVLDSRGTERDAPLFFVSANQVNYLVPAGTAPGTAIVRITSGNGTLSGGVVQIAAAAPGLFSATANGRGLPAANALRVKADNTLVNERVAVFDLPSNQFVPIPIDLGPEGEKVFLILYGTGVRGRSALTAVKALIGEAEASVSFAGAQGGLVGLDQLNLGIPRALAGRGLVDVVLIVDGQPANILQVSIK